MHDGRPPAGRRGDRPRGRESTRTPARTLLPTAQEATIDGERVQVEGRQGDSSEANRSELANSSIEEQRDSVLLIRVQGPAGEPIEGSLALDASAQARPKARSDKEGLLELNPVPEGLTELYVTALGHRVEHVVVTAALLQASGDGEPLILELKRVTQLTLHVSTSSVDSVDGLMLVLKSSDELFEHENYTPDYRSTVVGATGFAMAGGGRRGEYVGYDLVDSQPVIVTGLKADSSLTLQVQDGYGAEIHEEVLQDLYLGEWRERDLMITGTPRDLTIEVRSESGALLPGANVSIAFNESTRTSMTTDDQGIVRMLDLWGHRGYLRVDLTGYAPIQWSGYELPSNNLIQVRLPAGLDLRVLVRDEAGRAPPARVLVHIDGFDPFDARSVADGEFLASDLPAGLAEIRVNVNGVLDVSTHDVEEGEVVIEWPAHGSVEVGVESPPRPRRVPRLDPGGRNDKGNALSEARECATLRLGSPRTV